MRWCGAFILLAGVLAPIGAAPAADPSTLWRIVHEGCVPDEEQYKTPTPCVFVDLSEGEARGYVVLKDIKGATQYLVLPTARVPGIESPVLLAADAPNYLADAWAARRFVLAHAAKPLPREDLSLAVNSVYGRTQNQLHVHVDCVRADVRDALARRRAEIGDTWQPFPAPLAGHSYVARRLLSPDLAGVNPFVLVADAAPDARQHMDLYTLFLAGATFAGKPGFVLLADRADPPRDFASSEELQDHACAAAALAPPHPVP